MDLCEFEYIVCTKMFPAYTPKTLGETYIDIIMPIVEWYLSTNGGKVKPKNGDLQIAGKVYQRKNADEVNWL